MNKTEKARNSRSLYAQIFFVALTIALIVFLSYLLARNILEEQLRTETDMTLSGVESRINSDLQEIETALGFASEHIRELLVSGADLSEAEEHIKHLTVYGREQAQITGLINFYAMFDIYEEQLGYAPGYNPVYDMPDFEFRGGDDFDPTTRPWYVKAVAANGAIISTDAYIDVATGEVSFTYARSIYDDDGERIATVCVDVALDRIYELASDSTNDFRNYWSLLDSGLIVLFHRNTDFLGQHFSETTSAMTHFAVELERGQEFIEGTAVNYSGNDSVVTIKRLDNGWYLAVITPIAEYYDSLRTMQVGLILIGVLLAVALCTILIRMTKAKENAENEMQQILAEKASMTNLENTLNGLDAKVFVTEVDSYEILFMNDSLKHTVGIYDDYIGHKCYKRLRGFDEICSFCPRDKFEEDPTQTIVWELEDPSVGRTLQHTSRYITWTNGKTVYMQHSIDITERRATEREAREKSEMNQVLFDNAPIGVTVFDKDFKYIDCNEAVLKIYGVTREFYSKFFGSKDHSPEFQPDGANSLEKAMEVIGRVMDGETMQIDWVHLLPSGEPLPVELTMTRILRDGKYIGLGYIYDLREHHKIMSDLEQALYREELANKAKSVFLANMSHEIRTPMNAILGVAEIQLQKDSSREENDEAFRTIYDSGTLLLNIINDILDHSKIEAGKLEIVPVRYDVPSLINDVVQVNRLHFEDKPIAFVLDLDENAPLNLIGDEFRIKQVLNNILSNAFKYTDSGEVKMTVAAEPAGSDVALVVSVSDTGYGMSKKQLGVLFEEYVQFHTEVNRTNIGTGLGLSITKRILDLMNGEISVESEVNKGSTFTVRIPQKRVDELVCGKDVVAKLSDHSYRSELMSKKSGIKREHMPHGSVLVVDDVSSNTYVAKGMLTPYGLNIDTASGGAQAIELVKSGKKYDIIFMDHMMPKMDGIEATGILREIGFDGSIIALTANALVGQAEMFMEKGFDGFLAKPIDSRELDALLNKFINKA